MPYFHQSDFYLGRIIFINPALYGILFITPASSYTVFFPSLQLLFIQYSFHHSSFYLYSILFFTPASI